MSLILMGRSISRIRPLIKLLMRFCAPNPTPIASAPPNNANAVKGILTVYSANSATSVSKA